MALLALLAALVATAATAGAEGPPEPGPDDAQQVGGGKDEKVVLRVSQGLPEPWHLPPDYRNPDGSFNQPSLVAQQKRRVEVLHQRLLTGFRVAETEHFLVVTDDSPRMTAQFVAWSESLYRSLCAQFGISPSERVWDGKCLLMLFSTRRLYERHGVLFDGFNPTGAGAYFAWEARPLGQPQLVHIAIPLDRRDARRLQELFAHEATHAFFQLYKRPVDLPVWLHEGLAEYMTVVNDASLKAKKQSWSRELVRRGRTVQDVLRATPGTTLSYPAYSVSYTLVDFLLTAGRPRFRAFIDALKSGKDQGAALRDVYGWDLYELERRWRRFVSDYIPRHH